jgi:hypothetical protein
MTTPLTANEAERRYKEGVLRLEEKYGSVFRAPSEEVRDNSERLRAFYVIQKYGGSITRHILSQYMIPPTIAEAVLNEVGSEGIAEMGKKVTRADQYKAFDQWASEHDSEQYTTEQLVEVSGFSYQTTLKFIEGNPHFHKIKRGLYECRDAERRRAEAGK